MGGVNALVWPADQPCAQWLGDPDHLHPAVTMVLPSMCHGSEGQGKASRHLAFTAVNMVTQT